MKAKDTIKVIICGVDGEDFTDAKIGLSEWSDLLHEWKN